MPQQMLVSQSVASVWKRSNATLKSGFLTSGKFLYIRALIPARPHSVELGGSNLSSIHDVISHCLMHSHDRLAPEAFQLWASGPYSVHLSISNA